MKIFILFTILMITLGCSTHQSQTPPAMRTVASSTDEDEVINPDIYPYRVSLATKHEMRILNNGTAAFYARIDMIRRAKETLELEYFIFNPDTAGRIIIKELVKAAERGVKVRLLIDKSLAVFVLNEFYAKVMREHKIEVRYYNTASSIWLSTIQFRNHRKLIVRDGEEAITGGRNIADEYFNLSEKFNFLDRDVWVKGEIVKAMRDSFNLYWDSDIVKNPKEVKEPQPPFIGGENQAEEERNYEYALKKYREAVEKAKELVMDRAEDNEALQFAMTYGEKQFNENPAYECPEVSFATDREGATFIKRLRSRNYHKNYRLLRKEIAEWMSNIQDEIILDSPYFLNDRNSLTIVDDLFANKKRITIHTNSLASTDAIYVSAVFNEEVKKFTGNELFNAYIYKGTFSGESEVQNEKIRNAQWGTHSKTIVFSDSAFMIGTFNIDNRSNFYNTEMALFCKGSPELTKQVKDNILLRMKNAKHLNKEGKPDDGSDILEGNSKMKKMLYYLLKIPSAITQFLF